MWHSVKKRKEKVKRINTSWPRSKCKPLKSISAKVVCLALCKRFYISVHLGKSILPCGFLVTVILSKKLWCPKCLYARFFFYYYFNFFILFYFFPVKPQTPAWIRTQNPAKGSISTAAFFQAKEPTIGGFSCTLKWKFRYLIKSKIQAVLYPQLASHEKKNYILT